MVSGIITVPNWSVPSGILTNPNVAGGFNMLSELFIAQLRMGFDMHADPSLNLTFPGFNAGGVTPNAIALANTVAHAQYKWDVAKLTDWLTRFQATMSTLNAMTINTEASFVSYGYTRMSAPYSILAVLHVAKIMQLSGISSVSHSFFKGGVFTLGEHGVSSNYANENSGLLAMAQAAAAVPPITPVCSLCNVT
jgi:hypothetical protein